MKTVIFAGALAALCLAGSARAQDDTFFLGHWVVSKAEAAPWAVPGGLPDAKEMKSFLGKTITFEAKAIRGPGLLACTELHYRVVESPPEGLFQGAFEEMQRKDKSADPAKLAAAQGFTAPAIRTLQTGCANELDYHFVDGNTAEFALSDAIYMIKRK